MFNCDGEMKDLGGCSVGLIWSEFQHQRRRSISQVNLLIGRFISVQTDNAKQRMTEQAVGAWLRMCHRVRELFSPFLPHTNRQLRSKVPQRSCFFCTVVQRVLFVNAQWPISCVMRGLLVLFETSCCLNRSTSLFQQLPPSTSGAARTP